MIQKVKCHVGVIVLFVCFTLALTFPLCMHLQDNLPSDPGDPFLNTYLIRSVSDHLLKDPLNIHELKMFFPYKNVLAYSENLIGLSILSLPVRLLTENPLVVYNLLFLFSFVFCGYTAFLFLFNRSAQKDIAFLGAFIVSFSLYRIGQMGHLQVLSSYPGIAALFFLFCYRKNIYSFYLAMAGLCVLFQFLCCGNTAVFLMVPVAMFAFFHIFSERGYRKRALVFAYAVFFISLFLSVLFFYWPNLSVSSQMGFQRNIEVPEVFSADLLSFLTPPSRHWLFQVIPFTYPKPELALFPGFTILFIIGIPWILWLKNRRASQRSAMECRVKDKQEEKSGKVFYGLIGLSFFSFLGGIYVFLAGGWNTGLEPLPGLRLSAETPVRPLTVSLLALFAALAYDRKWRAFIKRKISGFNRMDFDIKFFVSLCLVTFFLSLGPVIKINGQSFFAGPYALLHHMPGFNSLRVPARFFVWMHLSMAGLGTVLFSRFVLIKGKARAILIFFLFALAVSEAFILPYPLAINKGRPFQPIKKTEELSQVYKLLAAKCPDNEACLELPMLSVFKNCEYMYSSVFHRIRIANGYSGFFPPLFQYLQHVSGDYTRLLNKEFAKALLSQGHIRYLLFHKEDLKKSQVKTIMSIVQYKDIFEVIYDDKVVCLVRIKGKTAEWNRFEQNYRELEMNITSMEKVRILSNREPEHTDYLKDKEDVWGTKEPQRVGEYLLFQLDQPEEVSGMIAWFNQYLVASYPENWVCELSLDGKTWKTVARDRGINLEIASLILFPRQPFMIISFPPQKAAYIRLRLAENARHQWKMLKIGYY